MIGVVLAAVALAAHPPAAFGNGPLPLPPAGERKAAAAPRPALPRSRKDGGGTAAAVDAVARRYALAGEVLDARGNRILLDRGYGPLAPAGGAAHKAGERWRLASITKQVAAAMIVRNHLAQLDQPLSAAYGMPRADDPTVRQLLQHHSGYPNPDDTPSGVGGVPAFYAESDPLKQVCATTPRKAGGAFSYNNCDYIIVSGLLGFAGGEPDRRWPAGLSMAGEHEIGVPGYVHGKPEPPFRLANWGAAGGLMGSARAVFDFDRSLMTGKLLPPAALAELWKPEGNGSYQALGQWVFPGKLAGCAAPKRIVQRDGEIYGVQARNYILPDDDLVAIVFTNRSADDFAIGEVWEGKGFAYDLLSAAMGC